jgi:hypothetical protein
VKSPSGRVRTPLASKSRVRTVAICGFGGLILLAVGIGCGPSEPAGGPGLPGAPPPPAAGKATSRLAQEQLDESGGSITLEGSAGGSLTVVVPPGALLQPTTFALTELSPNTGYGAVGSAFRIEPLEPALAQALTLRFTPPPGDAVKALTAAYQDATGYWFRVYAAQRDEGANTLEISSRRGGDWSLGTLATQKDLQGLLSLQSTQGLPFTLGGEVVLQYVGEYPNELVYVVTGTLTANPAARGSVTCTPDAPNPYPIRPSVAELRKGAPAQFRWGINGQWTMSCEGESGDFVSTNFDTLGITNLGCTRGYVGASTVSATHVRGRYVIDCGVGGSVTGAWDLVPPGQIAGPLP